MNVRIFVEGGGDNEDTITRCRQGFGAYCAKVAGEKSRPRIIPCGGRGQTFKKFKNELKIKNAEEICALLVDAEASVSAPSPTKHLEGRDRWHFSELDSPKVFLMVQAMEAWFLADREALAAFYGRGFLANSLPGNPTNVEAVLKDNLERSLRHASKPTTKGEYHKTKHGFALLALIDPARIGNASPHAKQFNNFLRNL